MRIRPNPVNFNQDVPSAARKINNASRGRNSNSARARGKDVLDPSRQCRGKRARYGPKTAPSANRILYWRSPRQRSEVCTRPRQVDESPDQISASFRVRLQWPDSGGFCVQRANAGRPFRRCTRRPGFRGHRKTVTRAPEQPIDGASGPHTRPRSSQRGRGLPDTPGDARDSSLARRTATRCPGPAEGKMLKGGTTLQLTLALSSSI